MASYETKRIFGQNLTRILDANNITQLELSQKMNVAPSSVSSWCNGDKMPRMDKIEWLVDFFHITKSELLELKSEHSKNISDEDIQFALFGGNDEITAKMFEEVKSFADYLKQREGYK